MNPGFELIDSCPYTQDQVSFAPPWSGQASPELYNSCATQFTCTVPVNWTGSQYAHSGNGYVGLSVYNYYYNGVDNRREYIRGQLYDTLKPGDRYCIEFYASRSDSSFWAINRLGLYISVSPTLDDGQGDTIDVTPQIAYDTSSILVDTTSWVRISGEFIANGGEGFITIGNFYPDSETDTLGNLGNFIWAYYYIDDVSVYEISDCIAGNDVSICFQDSILLGVPAQPNIVYSWFPTFGLSNPNISNPTASPDTTITYTLTQMECDAVSTSSVTVTVDHGCHSAPTIIIPSILFGNQNLFISGLESNSKLELFDERGRLVFSQEDYQNDFWSTNLAQGMYVARLTRPNGETLQQKVGVVR